jgi:hypothetical protein
MCWRSTKLFFARGSTGAGVTFAALRRGHVDAGEQQSQVRRGELKASLPRSVIGARRGIELLKGAGLESLDAGITIPSFLWRYTNLARSSCRVSHQPLLLSDGTDLGNDQLGVPGGDPGAFSSRELPEATNLVFVGPYDQMLS